MKLSMFRVGVAAAVLSGGTVPRMQGAVQFEGEQAISLGDAPAPGAARSSKGGSSAYANPAFDGRLNTYWESVQNPGESSWIEYRFDEGTRWALSGYSVANTGRVEASPRSWKLQGSQDGETWVTLDDRTTSWAARRQEVASYTVDSKEAYSRYRVLFTSVPKYRLEVAEIGLILRTHVQPPEGFSAETERGGVVLRWQPSAKAETYAVRRAVQSKGPFTVIASGLRDTRFVDKGPFGATEAVYYTVSSELGGSAGAPSQVAIVTPPVEAPTGVTIKRGDGSAVIEWSPVPSALAYVVRRALQKEGPYTTIATQITAPAFNDTGLTPGTAYHYVVCGVANGKEGLESDPVTVAFPPQAPAGLKAEAARDAVMLTWNAVPLAKSYQVLRATSSDATREFVAEVKDATAFSDPAVSVNRTYYYSVVAVNECGSSGESNVVSGSPQKPTSWWRR